jgi:type III secretion protein U
VSGGSSSTGEKTELPTPKRIRDARAKGQVARSAELVTAISLMGVLGYLWLTSGFIFERVSALLDRAAAFSRQSDFESAASDALAAIGWETIVIVAPVLLVAIVAGVAANYIQIGSLFAFEGIMPSLDKINPATGFKKIFSMRSLVELLKSTLKIAVLSAILFFVIRDAIAPLSFALSCGMPCIASLAVSVMGKTLACAAVVLAIAGLADLVYQRHAHTKQLMMTKEEIKREYKESEGDPHIKGKRRQLAQEMVMSDQGGATRKATAVVINPTHLAVVLRYREGETPLPMVVAKGRELQAHYLRTEAEAAGVPIFRNVGLARSLYAHVEPLEYIPDDAFAVVAEILAWVKRHEERLYKERLPHGVIDMDEGEHLPSN